MQVIQRAFTRALDNNDRKFLEEFQLVSYDPLVGHLLPSKLKIIILRRIKRREIKKKITSSIGFRSA
jgi:hypothetical protein